jgi:hypothetical protein
VNQGIGFATVKGDLRNVLKDTPEAQRFIAWVVPTLDQYNATASGVIHGKMKHADADYQQIKAIYDKAKALQQAIDALGEPARLRLASSGFWEEEHIPLDLCDLMFAAGFILDQQVLNHGEKQGDDADVARVRIIAHGFRTFLKNRKISYSENSVFNGVVSVLLDHQSPKALIKKACKI